MNTQSKSCNNPSQTKGEAIQLAEVDGDHFHAHFLCSYLIWKCSCFAICPLPDAECVCFFFFISKAEAANVLDCYNMTQLIKYFQMLKMEKYERLRCGIILCHANIKF